MPGRLLLAMGVYVLTQLLFLFTLLCLHLLPSSVFSRDILAQLGFPLCFHSSRLALSFLNLSTQLNTLAAGNTDMVIRAFSSSLIVYFTLLLPSLTSKIRSRASLPLSTSFYHILNFFPFFKKNKNLHLFHIFLANLPGSGKLILAITRARKGTIFHFIFIISVFFLYLNPINST